MDYGEILGKAWKITWKFKVLWIFGFLASCGQSSGFNGNFNNNFRTSGNEINGAAPNLPPAMMDPLNRFVHLFDNPAFIWEFVAIVIAIVCILAIIEIFLGTMGRIGLIKGSAQADASAEKLGFGQLWRESLPYFWRVFWLSFLIGTPFIFAALAVVAGFIAILIPFASSSSSSAIASSASFLLVLLPVLCAFFCIIFILAIIVGFISTQAERAIVLEDKSILDGFKRGWEVLTKNLGPILIVWLITAAIGLVAGIVIALPLLVVMVPLVLGFLASMNNSNFPFMPWIIALVCVLCAYTPIAWLFNAVLMTYVQSVWTLTYTRLTKPKPEEQVPVASQINA